MFQVLTFLNVSLRKNLFFINFSPILNNLICLVDTFIRVSDSLGFRIRKRIPKYKDIITQIVSEDLFSNWKSLLYSNIQQIEIENQKLTIENGSISVTYIMKLDPRISKSTQAIMRLIDFVNSTLYLNESSLIYSNITQNYTSITSYALPYSQISSNFNKKSRVGISA